MTTEDVLFSLLTAEVCGRTVSEEVKASLSEEMLTEVYGLAKEHDLAHLVGDTLSKLGVLCDNEISRKFKQAAMQAVYRYVRLDHAYQQICQVLEEAKIPFIPLKGSVLRSCYPESWMRTSCDIDILVREDSLTAAIKVLEDVLGYELGKKGSHDVSLYLPMGVHLELHYDLIEGEWLPYAREILARYWDMAVPCGQRQFHLQVSDELFYFYHVAHMAKHVEIGGCGIRTFLDLWVLNHRVEFDREKREKLLAEGSLLKFAEAAEALSEIWFSGAEKDAQSAQFEEFILKGGTYGTLKNHMVVQQRKMKGGFRYALSRVFLPYRKICFYYPVLQVHKWLTPVFQVVRWCRILFKGGVKRALNELQVNAQISQEEKANTEGLLEYLGLE